VARAALAAQPAKAEANVVESVVAIEVTVEIAATAVLGSIHGWRPRSI
jgi:hypothetical protein